jgi:hypothetical protein
MAAKWKLDPDEVGASWSGGSSSQRGRHGRMRTVSRSCRYSLRHMQTGLQGTGEIPSASYTKSEMRRLREKLHQELFRELETKVAMHLRVSGR